MITLGGKSGAGKGAVSRILTEQLDYECISIGDMKRALAAEMGLSITEFDVLGDEPGNAAAFDLKYDEYQQSLDPQGAIVLDGRLGFYNQPKAFNVFLDVELQEAATRIFEADRATDAYVSVDEVREVIQVRENNYQDRYQRLYQVDLHDLEHYDLVIDTTRRTPEQVAEMILTNYAQRQTTHSTY